MDYIPNKEALYEMELSRYQRKYKGSSEIEYNKFKIGYFKNIISKNKAVTKEEIREKIKKDFRKSINDSSFQEWLDKKVEDEYRISKGSIIKINKEIKYYQNKIKLIQLLEKEEIIDLSIEKNTEKIILLHQLGIIEFLNNKEPFNTSVNKLAIIISAITGIKPTTTQSYLNPMLNENTDQKSNPLNTTKSVEKIKQKLLSINYNLGDIK